MVNAAECGAEYGDDNIFFSIKTNRGGSPLTTSFPKQVSDPPCGPGRPHNDHITGVRLRWISTLSRGLSRGLSSIKDQETPRLRLRPCVLRRSYKGCSALNPDKSAVCCQTAF